MSWPKEQIKKGLTLIANPGHIWRPQPDLNRCCRRERPVSLAGLDDGDAGDGGPYWTRTSDSLLKRQILYPPELTAPLDSKVRENLLNCQAKYKRSMKNPFSVTLNQVLNLFQDLTILGSLNILILLDTETSLP